MVFVLIIAYYLLPNVAIFSFCCSLTELFTNSAASYFYDSQKEELSREIPITLKIERKHEAKV